MDLLRVRVRSSAEVLRWEHVIFGGLTAVEERESAPYLTQGQDRRGFDHRKDFNPEITRQLDARHAQRCSRRWRINVHGGKMVVNH